jgi:CHAD domain-containing protein
MKTKSPNHLGVHLAECLGEARHGYGRCLKRCRKKISKKAVHRLRVETRRLLALLDFLEAVNFEVRLPKITKVLKKRLDAFDGVRDTQVQLELLKPLWREFPEARCLKEILRERERRFIKKARRKIRKPGNSRLQPCLRVLEKRLRCEMPKLNQRERMSPASALAKCFARVAALRRQIRGPNPAAIHRMRVGFKRIRYIYELLQPFLPWLTREQLRRMRSFQTTAGDIQDLEILLARLDQFIQKKKVSPATIKKLRQELIARQENALGLFMKRIDELFEFKPSVAMNWKD